LAAGVPFSQKGWLRRAATPFFEDSNGSISSAGFVFAGSSIGLDQLLPDIRRGIMIFAVAVREPCSPQNQE